MKEHIWHLPLDLGAAGVLPVVMAVPVPGVAAVVEGDLEAVVAAIGGA